MRVLGIDEVGRGSIAGPLVVGAVVLDTKIAGLKDSKLLSRVKRTQLAQDIYAKALFCGLGWVTPLELDEIGLTKALTLASFRALTGLELTVDKTILDGKYNYLPSSYVCETIIGADNKVSAVSAASIIAKVARDEYMIKLSAEFPNYGFESHVGYCTQRHVDALKEYGCSVHHRKSFEPIKSISASPARLNQPNVVKYINAKS